MKTDGDFRHESLQSRKTIKAFLEAVTKGVGKGQLTLSDAENEITLDPDGLLTLRVRGSRSGSDCRLDLRITWSDDSATPAEKAAPKVS